MHHLQPLSARKFPEKTDALLYLSASLRPDALRQYIVNLGHPVIFAGIRMPLLHT